MKGYKTWIAVIGMLLMGVYSILNGNVQEGINYIVGALALLGIGHKIEKLKGF